MAGGSFLWETATTFQPSYATAQAEAALVFPGVLEALAREIPLSGHVTNAITGAPVAASLTLESVVFNNGEVIESGEAIVVADAYADPRFNREVDARSGFRTQTILCLPVKDAAGRTFAAIQLVNKAGGASFDESDARLFAEFGAAVGVLLQCWTGIHRHREARRRESYTGTLEHAGGPEPIRDQAR